MPRPRTPVGAYGNISVTQVAPGVFEARTRFRMRDGRTRRPRARGKSATAAMNALKERLTRLEDEVRGRAINPATRMTLIAELWLADLEKDFRRGLLAPSTLDTYQGQVRRWVVPKIGELSASEVTVTVVDDLIQEAWDRHSYATAKSVRNVLSGVCGYAVRHGAMDSNPVRSAKHARQDTAREIKALEPAQRADLLAKLADYGQGHTRDAQGRRLGPRQQVWIDLADLMVAMLATGARIGEVLAVTGDGIDPTNRTVLLDHHLVQVKGQGVVRMPSRKGRGRTLSLRVPSWSLEMWRRRKLASGGGPVFPAWNGAWLNPSNTMKKLRKACDAVGYDWVSSHVFRKTTATHLDRSALPASAIADQLGNTVGVVERHYRAPRVVNEEAVAALETMFTRKEGTNDGP